MPGCLIQCTRASDRRDGIDSHLAQKSPSYLLRRGLLRPDSSQQDLTTTQRAPPTTRYVFTNDGTLSSLNTAKLSHDSILLMQKMICKHKGLIPDLNVKACQPI